MKRMLLCGALVALVACGGGEPKKPVLPDPPTAPACAAPSQLMRVEAVLAENEHPCRAWVASTTGRVYGQTNDSAFLWARTRRDKLGVIVSAAHAMGQDMFGMAGKAIPESLVDPSTQPGITRLYAPAGGGRFDDRLSALFVTYHPEIPADESGSHMIHVRPVHDFFVAIIDGQRLSAPHGLAPMANPMRFAEEPVDDPLGRADQAPATGTISPGASVLMFGVPKDGDFAGELAVSVGRILTDEEATAAITGLARYKDEEGTIPYDPAVEVLVEGRAGVGMSGGPAFDAEGRPVGILVRASDPHDASGLQVVRFVRLDYLERRLAAALAAAPPADRPALDRIYDFLPTAARE